jgi:hypothetical protein
MYKNLVAPTLEAQYRSVNDMNKSNPIPPIQLIKEGMSLKEMHFTAQKNLATLEKFVPSQKQEVISQRWNDIDALAFAYYNDASLQEMLSNWDRDDKII